MIWVGGLGFGWAWLGRSIFGNWLGGGGGGGGGRG